MAEDTWFAHYDGKLIISATSQQSLMNGIGDYFKTHDCDRNKSLQISRKDNLPIVFATSAAQYVVMEKKQPQQI